MDSPSPEFTKRKRSPSQSSENAGAPPASRRRSRSPEASKSGSKNNGKERQIEDGVAAMELSKKKDDDDAKGKVVTVTKEIDSAQRAEFSKLLNTRSGGVYIPPARLRAMQEAAAGDKTSPEYQRLSWDALRKSVTGIVNRVNISNIKQIIPEIFQENLIRGRGLFSRSVMKAQAASLPFTPVFAAMVAVINTKLPQVGELVLIRLVSQFRRAFKRNDKIVCHSSTTFIAHLVNQSVAHELLALQLLVLLLERPTDDSIEIAVGFTREVGAYLAENSPKASATVFERFRAVLNEGNISQRVQYMIEVLMQVRKDKFKDNPILPEGLDLVEEEEQITHRLNLEDDLQVQDGLNVFKFDPNYLENEEKYKAIKLEILGDESGSESGSESGEEDSDEDEAVEAKEGIEDRTETNLVNLRRIIYLTIMNALNYEEAVHKLLRIELEDGQEIELVNMIIECCSQERSYSSFYGLVGERFSKLNRVWTMAFEQAFNNYYTTIHRYETNRLRNIARFFGHMFATDAISWTVMSCVRMTEDDTTSSSRIFVKIMMQEVMEAMGLKVLKQRLLDPEVKAACGGMFPMEVPKETRFAINYWTSIGLGLITEDMREWLKNAPKLIMEQRRKMLEEEGSSSSDSSDTDSDSDSDSDSDDSDSTSSESVASRRRRRSRSRTPVRKQERSRTPVRRRAKSQSVSRSRSPPRRRSPPPPPPAGRSRRDDSPPRSPPRRRRDEDDRSPPRRRDEKMRERSPPPPPRSGGRDDKEKGKERPRDSERERPREPVRRDDRAMDVDRPPRRRSPDYGGRDERRPPRSLSPPRKSVPDKEKGREKSPPPHLPRGKAGYGGGDRDRDVGRGESSYRKDSEKDSGRYRDSRDGERDKDRDYRRDRDREDRGYERRR